MSYKLLENINNVRIYKNKIVIVFTDSGTRRVLSGVIDFSDTDMEQELSNQITRLLTDLQNLDNIVLEEYE